MTFNNRVGWGLIVVVVLGAIGYMTMGPPSENQVLSVPVTEIRQPVIAEKGALKIVTQEDATIADDAEINPVNETGAVAAKLVY